MKIYKVSDLQCLKESNLEEKLNELNKKGYKIEQVLISPIDQYHYKIIYSVEDIEENEIL